MPAELYQTVFLALVALACVLWGVRLLFSPDYKEMEQEQWHPIAIASVAIALAVWMGSRPLHAIFGDTVGYAVAYVGASASPIAIDWSREWMWQWLIAFCKMAHLSVQGYFIVVYLLYIGPVVAAVHILTPRQPLLAMLFVLSSLMYFSFGVNGLRNGVACHFCLLAFALWLADHRRWGAALAVVAFATHRSVAIPVAAFAAAVFIGHDVRRAVRVWLAAIVVSLVAGSEFTEWVSAFGFDDRMSHYGTVDDLTGFSATGFRWDFLLYSAPPVVLAWYVSVRKQLHDNWFEVLATTYCLANAFWVLVCRVAYSNRFAYLSWFLYPILVAYPLLHMPVWDDQDRRTGQILLAYCAFTVVMNAFYWNNI